MKRKIRRRNRRNSFLLSRRFATILIGLGFGLAFAGLLAICLFEGWQVVLGGAGVIPHNRGSICLTSWLEMA